MDTTERKTIVDFILNELWQYMEYARVDICQMMEPYICIPVDNIFTKPSIHIPINLYNYYDDIDGLSLYLATYISKITESFNGIHKYSVYPYIEQTDSSLSIEIVLWLYNDKSEVIYIG